MQFETQIYVLTQIPRPRARNFRYAQPLGEKILTFDEESRRNHTNKYLTVNRLEFVITYRCNSKCKHCQIVEEREIMFPEHVDGQLAIGIVKKVGESYHPESIMTFGGEPLLFPEVVYAIHEEATQLGIRQREVITNGYWSKDKLKANSIAEKLANVGVNKVSISVDSFHAESIPLEVVKETANALLNAGIDSIKWNPCWVISEDHNNEWNRRTKSILRELADLPIEISSGNLVEPEGSALVWLKEFLPKRTSMPSGKCGDIPYTEKLDSVKGISIEPDGKVAICKELYIGNAYHTDVIKLLEHYNPYKILEIKAIVEHGMEGLIDWAKKYGVEPDPQGYHSLCHLCTSLRWQANNKMRRRGKPY